MFCFVLLNCAAKSADSDVLRMHAQRVNNIRQAILKDMKQQRLLVPQSVADAVANRSPSVNDSTSTCDSRCLYEFVEYEFSQKFLEM